MVTAVSSNSVAPIAQLPRISLAALSQDDLQQSESLFDACIDHGFFLLDLTDSENGRQLLKDVDVSFDIGKAFFEEDLPTKAEFKVNSGNVGYKPLGVMKFKDGKSDLTEICAVSRDSIMNPATATIPRVFDENRARLQDTITRFHTIATTILQHLAVHLDVPYVALEAMHRLEDPSATVLRHIHNPPQKIQDRGDKSKRQASLLGHTDSGSLTILFTSLPGLQILPGDANEDDEAAWEWVAPEPGCAVVNVGDPLVQWTGGVLRSAFHRVLHTPIEHVNCDRYSFGYFLKPADSAPMDRLQIGEVIPTLDGTEKGEQLPIYDLWHQDKTKKIMKGHQKGVSRGGVGFVRKVVQTV